MRISGSQFNHSSSTSLNNFIPLDKIGQGSFSSVYKVRRLNDDQIYALKKVKIVALKEKQKQNALNEIRILASLASPYIVEYKEAFFDERLNLLCIVMEWANEGDLQKKIQIHRKKFNHFGQREIWKAAAHIIQGLHALHSRSILHRDIKSANVFISEGIYKLGDLNVSKIQKGSELLAYTQTGTPYYASPEVWRDEPYDHKSDIWSLGCIIYEICSFKPPFKGKDLQSLYKTVQKGLYDPISPMYSQELSDLIAACLKKQSKDRLSTEQLLVPNGILATKCKEYGIELQMIENDPTLLKTIKLPFDLKELKKKLPKSKYEKATISKKFSYTGANDEPDPMIKKNKSKQSLSQKSSKMSSSRSIEGNPEKKNRKLLVPLKYQRVENNETSTERKQRQGEPYRKYSNERNKAILKQISQIRKMSQPSRCYSQRYEQNEELKPKKKKDSTTQRKLLYKNSEESLMELEKRLSKKRKQLRKIGSIQKLNPNSYCYRPNLGLNSHMKKSNACASNILLKGCNVEAEPIAEERYPKRIQLNKLAKIKGLPKANSTPYMVGLSEAPRMKRILQGMQGQKKPNIELKGKLSSRYICSKY